MAHPRIFVSYSHADSKPKERLLKHLEVLSDAAEFDVWTDSQIAAGDKWEPAIEQALHGANIAILLITADFLTSDFIRHKEIPTILQRRESEDLRVYPILAKPCAWQAVPWIKETQLRPVAAKPVFRSGGRYADDELARITLELLALLELVMNVQQARDDAARLKAEQEKQDKEKKIAEVISADAEPARKIYEQIAADAQSSAMQRWTVLKDLQTKVFATVQDVTLNRSRTIDEAARKWEEYVRQA
jgi:hypothetical protein